MVIRRRARSLAFVIAAWSFAHLSSVRAGEPTEEIRAAIDQGVRILQEADLTKAKGKAQAIARLREIVYPLFDFEEMAKRSLGSHWRRITPQEQRQFVSAFTTLLEKTYAGQIDLYEGQKVAYTGEVVENNYAEVRTRVIGKDGISHSVNYKLHLVNGKWRIYDVVAENISVVNNYRAQFHRVIVNSSFQELMEKMKQRAS